VKKLEFLPRIERLGGIAALTMDGYRVHGQLSASRGRGWFNGFAFRVVAAVSNGLGAVVTFFVLSGFVLARSPPVWLGSILRRPPLASDDASATSPPPWCQIIRMIQLRGDNEVTLELQLAGVLDASRKAPGGRR
jgi:hypothetical protein